MLDVMLVGFRRRRLRVLRLELRAHGPLPRCRSFRSPRSPPRTDSSHSALAACVAAAAAAVSSPGRLLYALAYHHIYTPPDHAHGRHALDRRSRAAAATTIANEHWDDSLPGRRPRSAIHGPRAARLRRRRFDQAQEALRRALDRRLLLRQLAAGVAHDRPAARPLPAHGQATTAALRGTPRVRARGAVRVGAGALRCASCTTSTRRRRSGSTTIRRYTSTSGIAR